ncbi:MAG: SPASM domain-containing protein, partial [Armatimonadetes bacterium]|nr:SPASM domain-containing protein [Armatimonadota bacterium]
MSETRAEVPPGLEGREIEAFSLRGESFLFDVASGLALGAAAAHEAAASGVLAEVLDAAAADEQPAPPPGRGHLALMWAGECNLACTYCHAETARQPGVEVEPQTLADTVSFAERLLGNGCERVVFTFGFDGEPLLHLPRLRSLVEAVRQTGDARLRCSITTNGTLLTPDRVKELERLEVDVGLSLDGPREVHDAARRFPSGDPSYDAVLPGLFALRQSRLPSLRRVPAFVTLVPGIGRPALVAEHLIDLGFHRFTMVPARPRMGSGPVPGAQQTATLAETYGEYADRLLEALAEGDRRFLAGINPGDLFGRSVLGLCRRSRSRYGCAAGRHEFAVGPDGALYPCHAFYGAPKWACGSVSQGLDATLATEFAEATVEAKSACASCWARHLCGGGCVASAVVSGKGLRSPDEQRCALIRAVAREAVRL